VQIVRQRLPRWALLIGVWLSTGYWPLTGEAHPRRLARQKLLGVIEADLIRHVEEPIKNETGAFEAQRLGNAAGHDGRYSVSYRLRK